MNGIFYFVTSSSLYKYADDNTSSYSHSDIDTVVNILEKERLGLTNWFSLNHMKVNSDKFQAIAIVKKTESFDQMVISYIVKKK